MKKDVIIQARMGSTRLPGKVLKNLEGKPVLWHVIERVKQSKLVDDVIIATTTSKKDDQIVEFCKNNNIKCHRGSEDNVLERYYETAKYFKSDIVLRITSDCPLIDSKVIDEILSFYIKKNYHLVTNAGSDLSQRTYPRGLDTEIFSFNLLEEVFLAAKEKYQLEHVTPYIYENDYRIYYYKNKVDYSNYRLTLDTEEDYRLIKKVYHALYNNKHNFYLDDIIEFLNIKKSLIGLNKNYIQKDVVKLRIITRNDIDLLFEWANDPVVRKNSFNSDLISWEEHKKWFNRSINSGTREIFIAEINSIPIGQIKIDIENTVAELGYSINQEYRGNGYGKYMIYELIRKIQSDKVLYKEIDCLVGKVKENNIPSQRTFEKLGFEKTKQYSKLVYKMIM